MIGRVCLWCCVLIGSVHAWAQQVPQGMTDTEKVRYQKAQEHITRGNKASDRVVLLNQDIDSLSQLDVGGLLPVRLALQNEVYQRSISAGSLFTTGYGDLFSVLSEAYQRYQKQNPEIASHVRDAVNEGNVKMHRAHLLYLRSRRMPGEQQAMNMALQALEYQKESVSKLLMAGNLLVQSVEAANEERLMAHQSVPDSSRLISVTREFDNAGHREVIWVPAPNSEAHDVYYTVQFKTLTRQEPAHRMKPWYAGKETIEIYRFDQYYRYSVGRFTSLSEANSFIKKEQMMGFVVAYQGKERIPVIHAGKLLGR